MTTENIYQKLYQKVQDEYDSFYSSLKTMTTDQVLDKCYEKVFKEDIAACFAYCERLLSSEEARILLKKDNVLSIMYEDWMRTDSYYMEDIENLIEDRGRKELHKLKEMER